VSDPALLDLVESYDAQTAELQTLQARRVNRILLVASLYDSFILSEGEHLSELVTGAYLDLSLSPPPHITRVSTRARAIEVLAAEPFDLVITMAQVADLAVPDFGRAVKEIRPGLPVFLVAYNLVELRTPDGRPAVPAGVDRAFIWRGDVRLFYSMIKLVEDRENVEHDTRVGEVRTLILIEDSVPFYSSYLPMLYEELVKQTAFLISEEVNLGQRILRRRLRPKILLATSFEEGWALYERYRDTLLCVISDVRFARGGVEDPEAGIELLRRIRQVDRDTPLVLQSSREHYANYAASLGAGFLHKSAPTLLHDFRRFMLDQLGFGDFVFRLPDGTEVARATDVDEMLAALATVPSEALRFHGTRNHFSNWLMARTEFKLATALRQLTVSDFDSMEEMRTFLLETLVSLREAKRRGQVEDFDARRFDAASAFVRIGGGSLGGKGRGLAFMHELLSSAKLDRAELRIVVPRSAVIGTDVFDVFVESNDLLDHALRADDDRAIVRRFQEAVLPASMRADLATFLESVRYPIAVRSSSLLEDAHHLPAAGIYPTHMLPNLDPDAGERLAALERAIKHIYASTFFRAAKAYLAATPNRVEDEKMAVVIQQVIGRRHEDVVYPDLSGVARSHNVYPVGDMAVEDGIAAVALGLGRTVVEGGRALRFSPLHPQLLPQFSSTRDILEHAQRDFWALDLTRPVELSEPDAQENLVRLDLAAAEGHGTLWPVASTYVPEDDAIYDGLGRAGVRLVTFAPILKGGAFPLPQAIRQLLELGALGMSGPVEIEFAANVAGEGAGLHELALLQIRPLVVGDPSEPVDLAGVRPEEVLVRAQKALGTGRDTRIRDVVAVRMDRFDRAFTIEIADDVGKMNAKLQAAGRPYLLVGPGRWGTADRWLGIPVSWYQVAGARAMVECDLDDFMVEPSQGTHFFHNLTSLGIGYFTVNRRGGDVIDWDWLTAQPPADETQWVSHYELPVPLETIIDGRTGHGVVLKRVREA